MLKPRLLIRPTPTSTRLLATYGQEEILRAVLPAPSQMHARAAPTLLEGLSLCHQRPLCVVVYAGDPDASSALGLCDGFGIGQITAHYQVEVVDPTRRRHG